MAVLSISATRFPNTLDWRDEPRVRPRPTLTEGETGLMSTWTTIVNLNPERTNEAYVEAIWDAGAGRDEFRHKERIDIVNRAQAAAQFKQRATQARNAFLTIRAAETTAEETLNTVMNTP